MFRYLRRFLLSAVALTGACAGDLSTAPDVSSSILAKKDAVAPSRPAGGTCATTFVVDVSAPPLTLDIEGVCNLKHLGRTTMTARQRIDITNGHIENTTTYTAANGDMLMTTFSGQVISPPGPDVVFVGVETYISGTGRFASVSGTSALSGTATLAGTSGTGQYSTQGSLTY